MYNKLEEQEYASMVQKYRSEYGGRNLRGFCLEHKVSNRRGCIACAESLTETPSRQKKRLSWSKGFILWK